LRSLQYSENATTYSIGVPSSDKCLGMWQVPSDVNLDIFAEANKKATYLGPCRTSSFGVGSLWMVPQNNGVKMELCTNLLATEPVWAKINTTVNDKTNTVELKFTRTTNKIDARELTLPPACYLAVNSKQHKLKIPKVWSTYVDITRVINATTGEVQNITARVSQDSNGTNIYIEGYGRYNVSTQHDKRWKIYFSSNKTLYSHDPDTPSVQCQCSADFTNSIDKTVRLREATEDVRGIEAVYTGTPCHMAGDKVYAYWYNSLFGKIRYCVRFDGAEPVKYEEQGSEYWNYHLFDAVDNTNAQLPEACWNIPCR